MEPDAGRIRLGTNLNIAYFDHVGLASPQLCVAHCVWVDEAEQALDCARCRLRYPVRDDIPVMLVEEARTLER